MGPPQISNYHTVAINVDRELIYENRCEYDSSNILRLRGGEVRLHVERKAFAHGGGVGEGGSRDGWQDLSVGGRDSYV